MWQSKLAALVAAATLSFNASAALVQYDLSGTFGDGATVQGFFVQDTADKSVKFYNLQLQGGASLAQHFGASGSMDNLIGAFTHFTGAGPTSFAVFDDQDVSFSNLVLEFFASATAGQYRMRAAYAQSWQAQPGMPGGGASDELTNGLVTLGALDDNLRQALESGQIDVAQVVPQFVPAPGTVPEPGSMALLLLGAAGAYSVRRRTARRA